jgi:hypothetical protein
MTLFQKLNEGAQSRGVQSLVMLGRMIEGACCLQASRKQVAAYDGEASGCNDV